MPKASISISAIDPDNLISEAQTASGITISGTASDTVPDDLIGQTVSVTLGGALYDAIVEPDGDWSVNVSAAALGLLLDGGVYNVVASVRDTTGSTATASEKVTVDTTASLSIKPIDGNGFVNGKNAAAGITISGASTGGIGAGDFAGQTLTLTLDGVAYTATVPGNGLWSIALTADELATLTDGASYQVSISATDKAGNPASATATLTVDETATLSISPVDGDDYINAADAGAAIAISGTAGDSVASSLVGDAVTVTLNGQSYTGSVQAGGAWSVEVGAAAVAALTDGKTYVIGASFTDAAGNKATASEKVTVDAAASLSIKPIDGNGFVNGKNAAAGITISGASTGSDGTGDFAGQTLTLTLGGTAYTTTVAANGLWSVALTAAEIAALTDGASYQVSVSATDKAGNPASATATLTLDETAAISISPVEGDNYIDAADAGGAIAISGTAGDSVSSSLVGDTVTVTLNGQSYTGAVQAGGAWSVEVGAADVAALTDGKTYVIGASFTDAAGNKAATSEKVTVDTAASLSIKPIDGNGFVNGKNAAAGITISGASTGSDGTGDFAGHTLTLTLDGVAYTTTVAANGLWSIALSAAQIATLTDGTSYQVSVSATDKAGNPASATTALTLDETAAISISPVGGDDYINVADAVSGVAISGTASDSLSSSLIGDTVTVTLGGQSYTGSVQAGGAWSVEVGAAALAALKDGAAYVVGASFTDAAGNKASATEKVTVDTAASLSIKPIDGNGFVSAKNAAAGITISGVSTGGLGATDFAGQTLTLTLDGAVSTTTVAANGLWSVAISAAELAALTDGASYQVSVSATDKVGNPASATAALTVDETATLSISPVEGDNIITSAALVSGLTISGTSSDSVPANLTGETVAVTLNGKHYAGVIQSNGAWSVSVGAVDVSALQNGRTYAIAASVTDAVGNTAKASDSATVDLGDVVTLTVEPIDGNGFVNGEEAQSGIVVTGAATGSIPGSLTGQTVSVEIGANSYTGTVGADGQWSVDVGPEAFAALTDGQTYQATASVTDAYGVTASASTPFTLDEKASLTINPVAQISASDVDSGVTISGTADDSILDEIAGQSVTVSLGGQDYVAEVGGDGAWSTTISGSDLAALAKGEDYTVSASVSDKVGNSATTETTLTISNFAEATVDTNPLVFDAVRENTDAQSTISVTNTAQTPAENLDAAISGYSGGLQSASGSFNALAPGATDDSALQVSLDTSTAGDITGSVTIGFTSDSGHSTTALDPQTVDVEGKVYREASGAVQGPDDMIVHVDDQVAQTITVENTAAADGYSEYLIGALGDLPDGASDGGGDTGQIAAGDSGTLTVDIDTSKAGMVSGDATVKLQTDGTGLDNMGPTPLEDQTASINVTVNNYAKVGLDADNGTLTGGGTEFTLDLGEVYQGDDDIVSNLTVSNAAEGPADALSGQLSASGADDDFSNSGAFSFSGLQAGDSASLGSVTLMTDDAGTLTETFDIQATGSNDSGYSGPLEDGALTVTGKIDELDPPTINAPDSVAVVQGDDEAISVSVDDPHASKKVTFTAVVSDAQGTLYASGADVTGSGTTSLTITGTLADINSALSSLQINDFSPDDDIVSIDVTDQYNHESQQSVTVDVTPNPPDVTVPAGLTVTTTNPTGAVAISIDTPGVFAHEDITATLTDSAGTLSATGQGVSGAGTNTLTIKGTEAAVDEALATVSYTGDGASDDTINVSVTDGKFTTLTGSVSVIESNGGPPAAPISNLEAAILAMDSYDHGYGANLFVDDEMIGNFQITGEDAIQSDGFYALSYQGEGLNEISYRGTDLNYTAYNSAMDIFLGWFAGAGVITPQVDDAINFYEQVTKQSIRGGSNSSIFMTGHSLGGGLAGIVGALTGNTATVFDNMPWASAAFLEFIYENAQSLTNPVQIVKDVIAALQGNSTSLAPFPDASHVTQISTSGEVLAPVRALAPAAVFAAPLAGNLTLLAEAFANVDFGKLLGTIISTALYPEIAPLAAAAAVGLTAEANQVEPYNAYSISDDESLGSQLLDGLTQVVALHSMSLLVMLQYADDKGDTLWTPAGPQLFQAYNDDALGTALGLTKGGTGLASPSAQIQTEIAYSAIPSGSLVYGNTGIVALFHDGDALGQYFQSDDMPSGLSVDDNPKFAQDLANIAVEYAGFLAETKDGTGSSDGVITYDTGNHFLKVDVSDDTWTSSSGQGTATNPTILSETQVLNLLFDDTPLSSKTMDVGNIVIGGAGGTIDLSDDSGLDLVYSGAGDQTITTGSGKTDILSGPGDDTINVNQMGDEFFYVGGASNVTINASGAGSETLDVLAGTGSADITMGDDETLRLDDPTKYMSKDLAPLGQFNGQITGFSTTNEIDLQDLSVTSLTYDDDLTVDTSAGDETLKLIGSYDDDLFQYGPDNAGGSDISVVKVSVDPTDPSWEDTPSTQEFTITRTGSYLPSANVWVSTVAGDDGFDTNDDDFVAIDDELVTFDAGSNTATVDLTILGGDGDDDDSSGSSKTFGFDVRDRDDDSGRLVTDDTFTLTTSPSPSPPPPPPPPSPPPPVPISPSPTPSPTATALGCPHFTTFDGLNFDFQGAGEFIAAKSTRPGDTFQVQIRIEPEGSSDSSVSIITQIAVQVGSDSVTFGVPQGGDTPRPGLVMVNGVPVNIGPSNPVFTLPGGTITEVSSNEFRVVEDTGETVTVTPFGDGMGLAITIPRSFAAGSVEGFFGSDSGQANDFTLPDGTVLQQPLTQADLYQTFANAWRVTQADSLLYYAKGETTATFTNTQYPREILTLADFSPSIVAAAAALVAAAGITNPVLAADAEFDYITMGNPSFIAQDVAVAGTGAVSTTEATVTNPVAPPPAIGVLPVAASLTEATGGAVTPVSFDVNLTSATTVATVVDFAVTPNVDYISSNGGNNSGKQFFNASDFGGTLPSGSVTIAAGETSGIVTIDLPSSALGSAPDKWLGLSISSAGDIIYDPTAQVEVINAAPEPGILAQPAIEVVPGSSPIVSQYPAVAAKSGDDYTLNLGEVVQNEAIPQLEFEIANVAPNRGDSLETALTGETTEGFKLTGSQPGVIAAGGASSALTAALGTVELGAHDDVLTFSSSSVNDSGFDGGLPDTVFTIQYDVVAPALASIADTAVAFGAAHVGTAESQTVAISNAAPSGGANLDVSVSAGAGATASGGFVTLAPGATDSSHVKVGLATTTAGAISGVVTVNQFSDLGNGVKVAALPSPTISVSGDVYRYAQGAVSPTQAIVHVGDSGTEALEISNTAAADGFSENLIAAFVSSSGAISVSGGATGDIAAGASDDTTLTATFSTSTAGVLAGEVKLADTSDGTGIDGLGETSLGDVTTPVSITVQNFAEAEIADVTDPSALQRNGDDYTLNLGTVEKGGAGPSVNLEVVNSATGLADLLSGTFTETGDTSAFTNDGLSAFSGVSDSGAGDKTPFITLNSSQVGEFDEIIVLHGVGYNASGYSGALADETLTITGEVTGVAPPVITIGLNDSDSAAVTADPAETSVATSGTLSFTDPIVQYSHTVSVLAAADDLGTLTASVADDTVGTGTGGVIDWNYSVAESAAATLDAEQSHVDTFTITLSDGHGGTTTQEISVDVTGVDSTPVITVGPGDSNTATITSALVSSTLTTSGDLSFSEANLSDTHTVSVTAVSGDLGALTASVVKDTTGTGTGGEIVWHYAVSELAVTALGVGESHDDTFEVTLTNNNGLTTTELVTVTATDTLPSFTAAWASASGGAWGTGSNWEAGVTPGADDTVLIDLPSGDTVTFASGDDDTVGAVSLQGGVTLALTGGELTVTSQLAVVDGTLQLDAGGTLADATIVTGADGVVDFGGGTLSGATFVGPINLTAYGAALTVTNGLTVTTADGTGAGTITLGYFTDLLFEDTQTFDDATIDLTNYESIVEHQVSAAAALAGGAAVSETLTLGSGVTINAEESYDYLIDTGGYGTNGAIVNDGAINVTGYYTNLFIESGTFENAGNISVSSNATLTIEPVSFTNLASGVITLSAGTYAVFDNSADDVFVNAGKIDADDATITINDLATFENTGDLAIENSTLNLYGDLTPAELQAFAGENDTLDIYGALDNGGNTLTTGAGGQFAAIAVESGGVVSGGVLQGATGVELKGGLLDDVTVNGTLYVAASGYIANGLDATGVGGAGPGAIDVGGGAQGYSYYSYLYFENSQSLDDATLTLDGYYVGAYIYTTAGAVAANGGQSPLETLTIADDSTVEAMGSYEFLGQSGYGSDGAIINLGAIDVQSGTLNVDPAIFDNDGPITVDDATLVLDPGNFVNEAGGKITVEHGGNLTLGSAGSSSFAFENEGGISIDDASLTIYSFSDLSQLTSSGTFSLVKSTVNLYGAETDSALGAIEGDDNTLDIYGTLDNVGQTLTAGTEAEFANLEVSSGGEIAGGVVQTTSGLEFNGGTLDDVIVEGPISLGDYQELYIDDGVTLTGASGTGSGSITLGSNNEYEYGASLYFDNNEILDDATVTLAGYDSGIYVYTTLSTYYASDYDPPIETLTLGAGLTLDATGSYAYLGQSGYYYYGGGNAIVNYGAIDVEAGTLYIDPAYFDNYGAITVSSGATLTLDGANFVNETGGSITLDSGASLTIGQNGGNSQVTLGTVVADDSTLTIYNLADLVGTLTVSNSTIQIFGTYTAAELAPFAGHNNTLSVSGTLDDNGATLTADDFLAVDLNSGGVIEGGVIAAPEGLIANGGTLQGVTVQGSITIGSSYLYVDDGLTTTGADGTGSGAISLGNNNGYYGNLYFDNTQTVDDVTIALNGYYSGIYDYTTLNAFYAGGDSDPPETLTFGAGVTINLSSDVTYGYAYLGQSGYYDYAYYPSYAVDSTIVDYGQINVETGTLYIDPSAFDNYGAITVSSGATLELATKFTNESTGSIVVQSGGVVWLGGSSNDTFLNLGSIVADDAIVKLYWPDGYTNSGTLSVTNSTLDIYDDFTAAGLAPFAGQDDTIAIEGVLDNTGSTLSLGSLGDFAGIQLDYGGVIQGGVVVSNGGLTFDGGTLDDVVLQGPLTLYANQSLYIETGLTVTGADGSGPGAIALGDDSSLFFEGTQTFDDATVTLSGEFSNISEAAAYDDSSGSWTGTLTLGASLVIDATSGYALLGESYDYDAEVAADSGPAVSGASIVNNGAINVEGGQLTINPQNFVNNGAITVSDGLLTISSGTFDNSATASITLDSGANLVLGYYSDDAYSNEGAITGSGANLSIYNYGSFTNTGILSLTSSTITLYGDYTAASLSAFEQQDDALLIAGDLDNSGATFSATADDAFTGATLAYGGTISGGVVEADGLAFEGGTLDDVTFIGTLSVGGEQSLFIDDGLNFSAAVIGDETLQGGQLFVDNTETLDDATITLAGLDDGVYVNTTYQAYVESGYVGAEETLTLGSGLVLTQTGSDGTLGQSGYVYDAAGNAIVNDGEINVEAGTLTIDPANFVNNGSITVATGATLDIASPSISEAASGSIALASGATLIVGASADDQFSNAGTITGDDDVVTLYNFGQGTTSFGTIRLNDSTINLYGNYTAEDAALLIGLAAGRQDVFDIYGSVDLGGAELDAGAGILAGVTIESGATVSNGTLVSSPDLTLLGGTLDNVTLAGSTTIGANASVNLTVDDGLTLTDVGGLPPGSLQLGGDDAFGANLYFDNTGSLDNATLTFAGADDGLFVNTTEAAYQNNSDVNPSETLTLGPNFNLVQTSGAGTLGQTTYASGGPGNTVVGNGAIQILAGVFTINPATFDDNGSILVGSGATLNVQSSSFTVGAGGVLTTAGDLVVSPIANGSGQFDIDDNATLEFQSGASSTTNVAFEGPNGTLRLDNSAAFAGVVSGLNDDDIIDFRDIGFINPSQAVFSGTSSGGMLSISDGVHAASIALLGDYTNSTFVASSDGAGGVEVVDPVRRSSLAAPA